jgi:hypothetical protein
VQCQEQYKFSNIYGSKNLVLFAKYNQNNEIKEDEVGGTCSPNGGKEKCVKVFGGKARGKEATRKNKQSVGG